MFDLAGFVHHFPVDHGLSDHLDDLPGANVRLFCREEQKKSQFENASVIRREISVTHMDV